MNNTQLIGIVVDDHSMYRTGMKTVLKSMHLFSNLFEAANGAEALAIIDKNKVDIVFLDIEMPILNGYETAKILNEKHPNIKIIVVTMFGEPRNIEKMVSLNIHGYLFKSSSNDEFIRAIKMVSTGNFYYNPEVQSILLDIIKHNNLKGINKIKPEITKTQEQVLILLCNQKSTQEIAEMLNISHLTVKRHRQDLLDRTKSVNVVGLVFYAIEHKIINMPITN